MKYMLLIYGNEAEHSAWSKEALDTEMAAYSAFHEIACKADPQVVSEALHDTKTATSVKVRDGKTIVTDGPFAETREQLGGFYMLDCKDLNHAIELAAQIPSAQNGTVEIRPVVIWE